MLRGQQSRELAPIPGTDSAALPGSREWQREQDWARDGIPIPEVHMEILEGVEEDTGVKLPTVHPE